MSRTIDALIAPVLPEATCPFEIYVDSNWAVDHSVSGGFFFIMGCLFAWFSKNQKSIALSSAEAEMFGIMMAGKEGLFYRDLLFDLSLLAVGATAVRTDSDGSVDLSFDPVAFKKTKHIMRHCSRFRHEVSHERFHPVHIPGDQNIADMLTKPLPRATFLKFFRMVLAKMHAQRA